ARGRASRAMGDLVTLLSLPKNLPLAYNRDLQEDKRPLLGAPQALVETLEAVTGAIETATFHADRMREALGGGEALATDLAEYLVAKGVPFREAHEAIGKAAAHAARTHRTISQLAPGEWRQFHVQLKPDALQRMSVSQSLKRREVPGGPGPKQVAKQLARWEKALGISSKTRR
ncbi:MAG TPA: argininosuccinate lyase, partial [Anaeromyxobacteraceae bacterium]|nr:argininosuccinate lyase [Anaeromyxobacteraceae bacterium]